MSVLEAVLELPGQRGGGTCSCRWAGSVCVPPQASLRSVGCPPVAPQDQAAQAREREKSVRVPLDLEGLGLVYNSTTFTLFQMHSQLISFKTQCEQRGSSRQHTQKTNRIFAWHRAATDHRNKTVLG